MKVLLTGGSGFVGPATAKALAEDGHEVRCLVRATSDRAGLEALALPLTYTNGDICDAATLPSALDGVDAVVHVAGLTKGLRREDFFRVNEAGSRTIAQACVDAGVPRLIHCSSLAVAGPIHLGRPATEDDPPAPVSHYGHSKLAAEAAVRSFASRLAVTILRPPIVYGPRDRDFFEIFKMASRGLALKPGLFGSKRYSMIHVEDLGHALALALRNGATIDPKGATGRGLYYVSDGGVYAWEEVLREVGKALGRRNTVVLPVPEALSWPVGMFGEVAGRLRGKPQIVSLDKIREVGGPGWACSIDRARDELGYTPRYPLVEGLAHAASWYRANHWI